MDIDKNVKSRDAKMYIPGKRIKDECGVFGIYAPEKKVADIIFYGLQALQHRGQESAGIAVSDGEDIIVFKDLGLVAQVFNEQNTTFLDLRTLE